MKKSKIMTGPVREIPRQETKEEPQIEKTQTEETIQEEEQVREPDTEAGKIDNENISMTVYDDKNTPSQPTK